MPESTRPTTPFELRSAMYEGVAFRLMRRVAPSSLDHVPMQRMIRLRDMWRERFDALVSNTYKTGDYPELDALVAENPDNAVRLAPDTPGLDTRFIAAFESVLRTPLAREVFGDDASILDGDSGAIRSSNSHEFVAAFNEMREHLGGEHAPESGPLADSVFVPISPLDPAFRNSEAVYDAGDNQLLFAVVPTSVSRTELADRVRRWHDPQTSASAYGVPVVVADVEQLDSGSYLVKGYTGDGEGYGFDNQTLRTTADELGLSELRYAMGDETSYARLAPAVTKAWDQWFETPAAATQLRYGVEQQLRTSMTREQGREPSASDLAAAVEREMTQHGVDRMARFRRNRLAQQRRLVQDIVVPLVRWAREQGIAPRFELDSEPGQLLMTDDASGVTWRLIDQPGVADDMRRRFCCKPRINRSDDFEMDIRTAGNVSMTASTRAGSRAPIAHPDRVYDLDDRIALSAFACGITTEAYLPQGRTSSVGTRDAQYAIAQSSKTLYVPLREKHVRIGNTDTPLVLYAKRTPNRTNDYPPVSGGTRTPEEQARIRYTDDGRPYHMEGDAQVFDTKTHEDIVRFAIESARASVERQIDVEGLIQTAQEWYESSDRTHFPRPSFDRDGLVDDRFVVQARHDLWDMLTGRRTLLEKPYTPSTQEVEIDPYGEMLAPEGEREVMSQTDRTEYARAYVQEVLDRRIGTFDATRDMDGIERRFNMAEVIRYSNGVGGARSTDIFVRACREAGIDPQNLRGDEVLGSEGDYANQLRDRIAPFVDDETHAGVYTLDELRAIEDPTPGEAYRRDILETVASTISMMSPVEADPAEVAIDRFGLVRYQFVQTSTLKVKDGSELHPVTGYIGRFALPDNTLDGALRLTTPYAEDRIIFKQASAYVLPRDEQGSSRLTRTRVTSFDDRVRNLIVRTVSHDISGVGSGGRAVGSFDSMRSAYRSDVTGRTMSAAVYDRMVEEAEAFEEDPERFRAEALAYIENPESVGDDVLCPLPHNPRPAYTLAELTALERTRNAEVNYDRAFEEVNVATELGVTGRSRSVGTPELPSDRDSGAYALADWHSMATLTPEECRVFDVAMTKDTKKQCTKRYLVDGAQLSHGAAPVAGESGRSAIRELPVFKNADESAWNRQRMGGANYETGLMCDPTCRVAMMGGGGWTQDDGIVVSREFAETHRIHGADNVVRDLRIGDKVSDLHGNKGVISMVVDASVPEEAAAARGEAYHRLWQVFAANVGEDGRCRIDVMMNNVAPVSRKNSGLFRDMLDGEREPLRLADGTEVADGISTVPIEVHNKAVDKQTNFDNDSNTGWQLAYALADHEPHIMAEIYGDAAGGVRRIREALRVSVGADMANNGMLYPRLMTGPGQERRLIEYDVVPPNGYGDPADPESMPEGGAYPVGYAHEGNTLEAIMQHIDHEGGFIRIPFELTYPEHTVSAADTSSATRMLRSAFGLSEGEDVTIGGGAIAQDAPDAAGNPQWLLPIESAQGRASLEARGRQMRHDHSRAYQAIMRNAVRYENLRVQRDAYQRELDRLEQIPESERATTIVDRYYTSSRVGSIRGDKTADKVIARYRECLEGTTANGRRGGTKGIEAQMEACKAAAQAQFSRLANEVWTRNFTTSDNNIKNAVMRAPVVSSTYCVWTPDPELHLNEVRVGVKQAEKIGAADGDTIALWRSPVLLESNICALTVRVDETIDGCAVNPAIAGRIAGDFDGDKVSLWKPAYEGSREELAEKLSLERFLVNDRTAPSGTRVVDDNGSPREVKVYGLEIGLGLDTKLGRGLDARADELLSRGENLALLAWDKWASGEFGERDSDEALRQRDAGCHEALVALDEGVRLAQQASCSARALSFTDEVSCLNTFMDATVNPGVKGKPKDVAEVMTYLGLVPNKPETLAAHAEAGDLSAYLQGHVEGASLLDEFGMQPDEDGHYRLGGDEFISVEAIRRGTYEGELSAEAQQALVRGWEQSRSDAAASVSMAMDAKTNVTGPVGALPQGGYKAMPDDHTLIARLFQPLYQMSLDFKLDGYDAMAKVPYVSVFKDLVNRGQVYEELLDGRCTGDFAASNLTPRTSHDPLTPDEFTRAMGTLYARMGQDVNPELIERCAQVLSVERRDASGKTTTVVQTLPEFAAQHGAVLDHLAFDTSDTGVAAIMAIASGRPLFQEQSQEMAPLQVRVERGWSCENEEQERRARTLIGSFENRDVRVRAGEHVAANTRGLDVAVEMNDAQVSTFYGFDARELTAEQIAGLRETMCEFVGDGARELHGHALAPSAHEALLEACSRSDALVLVGNGTTSTVCVPYTDANGEGQGADVSVDEVMAYASEMRCAVIGIDATSGDAFEARFDAHDGYEDFYGPDATMDTRSAAERGRSVIAVFGRRPEDGCVEEMPRGKESATQRGVIAHPFERSQGAQAYEQLRASIKATLAERLEQGPIEVISSGERGGDAVALMAALELRDEQPAEARDQVRVVLAPLFDDQEQTWDATSKRAVPYFSRERYRQLTQAVDEVRLPGVSTSDVASADEQRTHRRLHDERLINQATDVMAVVRDQDRTSDGAAWSYSRVMADANYAVNTVHKPVTFVDSTKGSEHATVVREPAVRSAGVFVGRENLGVFKTAEQVVREAQVASARAQVAAAREQATVDVLPEPAAEPAIEHQVPVTAPEPAAAVDDPTPALVEQAAHTDDGFEMGL